MTDSVRNVPDAGPGHKKGAPPREQRGAKSLRQKQTSRKDQKPDVKNKNNLRRDPRKGQNGTPRSEQRAALLAAALGYAQAGIPVFPCFFKPSPDDPTVGKKPAHTKNSFHDATIDLEQIRAWWTEHPDALIGMPTGAASNIDVIDIDRKKGADGCATVPHWEDLSPCIVSTPTGGYHLHFLHDKSLDLKNWAGQTVVAGQKIQTPGVDTRTTGGYVILPPSYFPDGRAYTWHKGSPESWENLRSADLAHIFRESLAQFAAKAPKKKKREAQGSGDDLPGAALRWLNLACERVREAEPGTSDTTYNIEVYVAGAFIREGLLERSVVEEKMFEAAVQRIKEPEKVIREKLGRSIDDGIKKAELPVSMTALDINAPKGIARRLVQEKFTAGDERTLQRYDQDFYVWHRNRYDRLTEEEIRAEVSNYLEDRFCLRNKKLARIKPNQALVSNVVDSLKVVALARLPDGAPAWLDHAEDLPPPDELLAVKNGLLHLPSRSLLENTPNFFNLHAASVSYDPDSLCPLWTEFLNQLWPSDPQSHEALQDWFGYALSGKTNLQKMLLIVGPRRSGKGTIGRVLTELLGRNSVAGPTLASLGRDFGRQALINKSLALISDARIDPRSQRSLVEHLLTISGEDKVEVNRKYKEPWEGRLKTRIMILTNPPFELRDETSVVLSRFLVLELVRSFLGEEDVDLERKLAAEAPGILNWALDGYARVILRNKFIQPESAAELIDELEVEAAPVKGFVDECLIIDSLGQVPRDDLYEVWRSWCHQRQIEPGTRALLGGALRAACPQVGTRRGTVKGRKKWYYTGVKFAVAAPF